MVIWKWNRKTKSWKRSSKKALYTGKSKRIDGFYTRSTKKPKWKL